MGVCLGHQIAARALGAKTYKLKFGHRGGNHPVQDMSDGKVYITAQNHGYSVSADSLPAGLEVSHVNLNDYTVEGLRHKECRCSPSNTTPKRRLAPRTTSTCSTGSCKWSGNTATRRSL